MGNKKSDSTPEEDQIAKNISLYEQYDNDIIVGTEFLQRLPEILNKRYTEGWKYVQLFRVGEETRKIPIKPIYSILYERVAINTIESFGDSTSENYDVDLDQHRIVTQGKKKYKKNKFKNGSRK